MRLNQSACTCAYNCWLYIYGSGNVWQIRAACPRPRDPTHVLDAWNTSNVRQVTAHAMHMQAVLDVGAGLGCWTFSTNLMCHKNGILEAGSLEPHYIKSFRLTQHMFRRINFKRCTSQKPKKSNVWYLNLLNTTPSLPKYEFQHLQLNLKFNHTCTFQF